MTGSELQRDFATFQLGDKPCMLADRLLPQVADLVGVELGDSPDPSKLGAMVRELGPNPELRTNPDREEISRQVAIEFVEKSAILQPADRSLWTPDHSHPKKPAIVVVGGGVANWMDRVDIMLTNGGEPRRQIYAAVGNRVMDTVTEKPNYNILNFYFRHGRYPTETEYMHQVCEPRLRQYGHVVTTVSSDTNVGSAVADELFIQHREIADEPIKTFRVAGAGIQFTTTIRQAARKVNPCFDAVKAAPQLYYKTDRIEVAIDEDQEARPVSFQKAHPVLRTLFVSAKQLEEAAISDRELGYLD